MRSTTKQMYTQLLTAVSLMLIVVVVSLLVLTHLWALDAYRVQYKQTNNGGGVCLHT
jgi:uncharacterized membrane protein affecting hemolysin expression